MILPRFATILIVLVAECMAVPLFLIDEPKDVKVHGGDSITLDCVFSESAPKCYWSIDGEPIEFGRRYQLIGDSLTGNCTLRIHQVVPIFDEGVWTCSYPKDSYTNHAPRSRGSRVKVQVADLTEVTENPEVGSGEEQKSWEKMLVDQLEILKEEDLVAEMILNV